jgi:3-oxoacid CoA-transferase subunit B
MMMHTGKDGSSKLLEKCTLPLTGVACIKRVVTDLAYLEIRDGTFHLVQRAPGVSVEDIRAKTAGRLVVPQQVPEMAL